MPTKIPTMWGAMYKVERNEVAEWAGGDPEYPWRPYAFSPRVESKFYSFVFIISNNYIMKINIQNTCTMDTQILQLASPFVCSCIFPSIHLLSMS